MVYTNKGGRMSRVGQTSNHGMSTTDAKNELIKQEADLVKKNKGHVVACPYCGESFHFNKKEYSLADAIRLSDHLHVNKCPWCVDWKVLLDLCSFNGRMHPVVEHTFILHNGQEIKTIRKPDGWKGVRKAVKLETEPKK